MAGKYLTELSTIMCPHGGQAILRTGNSNVSAVKGNVLLESDEHKVAGCAFTIPPSKPSPCITIKWKAGTQEGTIDGTAILTASSVGECYSGENAMQGTAIIANTQLKSKGK